MNNYIKALQKFLQDDSEIASIVGNRIGFLRMEAGTQKPCIVFNEGERSPEDFSNPDYRAGIDMYPVLIDVIVEYKDSIIGRNLRNLIRKKIGSFKGILSAGEWEGSIVFKNFLACDYSSDTDGVIWGGLYLFKESYDYTNN